MDFDTWISTVDGLLMEMIDKTSDDFNHPMEDWFLEGLEPLQAAVNILYYEGYFNASRLDNLSRFDTIIN